MPDEPIAVPVKPAPKRRRARGDGSIYRRGEGWVGSINLGDIGGKRKRREVYAKSQGELLKAMAAVREAHRRGLPVAADRQTVGEYLTRWLSVKQGQVKPRTWESYEGIVRLHLVPVLGKVKLNKLAPHDVESMLAGLVKGGLTGARAGVVRRVLVGALAVAVKQEVLARNVAALATGPRVVKRVKEPLSLEETKKLLLGLQGHRFEGPYLVALMLGLRRGEVLGLKWSDWDLAGGLVKVTRQLQRLPVAVPEGTVWVGPRLALSELKTAGSRRDLPVPKILLEVMRRVKIAQAAARVSAGVVNLSGAGLCFTKSDGSPISPAATSEAWRPTLKAVGVRGVRLQDARGGVATLLLEQGVDLAIVSALLGHSSLAITADAYTSIRLASLVAAVAKLDAAFGP